MTKNKNGRGLVLIILGLAIIAAAGVYVLHEKLDEKKANENVSAVVEQIIEAVPDRPISELLVPQTPEQVTGEYAVPDYLIDPTMEMPAVRIEGHDYVGLLEIPSLDIRLPVISEWSYPNLDVAPCRMQGTAYADDLIILAHNYEKHFRKLKDIEQGAQVIFTDMDGNCFLYQAVYTEIINPFDVDGMITGDWDLTLFTCTRGGQYRVTVRCDKIIR